MIESELRTESHLYNQGTKEKQQIHEERNTAENWKPIMDALKAGRARDIHDEPKRTDGMPFIAVSSGPSLDEHIAQLKDWKGGIFCSTSHATTLMRYGIEPTHIVVLDPFCAWHEIAGIDWGKTRAKLIINPSVWPDLMARWPNEVQLYLQNIGRRDSFYATTQLHMFCERIPDNAKVRTPQFKPLIRTNLTLFACTPPAEIFTAQILGYGNGFLLGFDFANSPELGRFTRWQPDATGAWKEDVSKYTPSDADITTDNGRMSDKMMLYYKKNFLSAWRLSKQPLWTLDRWTALTEVPPADIEHVLQTQGTGVDSLPVEEIIRRTELYLARVGAYIITRPDGSISFVETPNPLSDLPQYMLHGRRVWECLRCKIQGTANDENDHTGDTCPNCGNVGMHRAADVNVDENMERFRRLVREAAEENERHGYKQPTPADADPGCAATVIGSNIEPVTGASVETVG